MHHLRELCIPMNLDLLDYNSSSKLIMSLQEHEEKKIKIIFSLDEIFSKVKEFEHNYEEIVNKLLQFQNQVKVVKRISSGFKLNIHGISPSKANLLEIIIRMKELKIVSLVQ